MAAPLLIAKNPGGEYVLLPALANRHGLIAGATGTGKTVTLQTLAQGFSSICVPVFMADVKGDLAGLAKAGGGKQSQGLLEAMAKSAARTVGSQVGREIVRGVLGAILGKRR